jgi:3-dehydroquinate dehydratase/shikimate dehydrogenase
MRLRWNLMFGLPYKEAVVAAAHEVETLAKQRGAVDTLVRGKDQKLSEYNTDCVGALTAIEDGLRGIGKLGSVELLLKGNTFVVSGAGGAGKALAFGAKARGAKVIIANRTVQSAQELADKVGGEAITLAQRDEMKAEKGFFLAKYSSVGMQPNPHEYSIATDIFTERL